MVNPFRSKYSRVEGCLAGSTNLYNEPGLAGRRVPHRCYTRDGEGSGAVELIRQEPDRSKRKHVCFAILAVTVALAVLAAAPAAWSDSSSAAAKRATKPVVKVTARIRIVPATGEVLIPVKVFFTPSVINVGTVTIVVRNSDPVVAHQISINGVYSRWMGPHGGTAVMKVTFKRPGTYVAGTFGGFPPDGGEAGGEGVLKVLK
jgi:hypothetical protein